MNKYKIKAFMNNGDVIEDDYEAYLYSKAITYWLEDNEHLEDGTISKIEISQIV